MPMLPVILKALDFAASSIFDNFGFGSHRKVF
jgi:hypothetical protein